MISGSHLHLHICKCLCLLKALFSIWPAPEQDRSRASARGRGSGRQLQPALPEARTLPPPRSPWGWIFLSIFHFLVILVILGLVTFDLHNHPLIGFWCKVKSWWGHFKGEKMLSKVALQLNGFSYFEQCEQLSKQHNRFDSSSIFSLSKIKV